MAWCQFSAGISQSIFVDTIRELPHLETVWIGSIRRFLQFIDATIDLDDVYIPQKQRVHDIHLMEEVIDSRKFTRADIKRVDLCRKYLQVHTLSDITNSAGTFYIRGVCTGTRSFFTPISREYKINQR